VKVAEGWHLKTIAEIGKVVTGSTPSTSDPNMYGGDIPFVTPGDLGGGRDIATSERTLSTKGAANARVVPAGSTLVTCIGSTIGKSGLAATALATNQQINAVIPDPSHDPAFVYYQIDALAETFRLLAGTQAVPLLNKSAFSSVKITVPSSKSEQQSIAAILSTWDQAISNTERLLANSQRCARDLMVSMLSGHRRFPGFSDKWRYVDLDTVFERVTCKNTTQNTNVLTISGEHGLISQRDYFNKSVASANLSGYTLLHRHDFAYNKSYSAGYPMGAIKPLIAYDAGVVSSLYLCFRIRSDVGADFDFFRHYFEAGLLNQEIEGIAQEGARNHGLLNVSVTEFFKLQLHIPSAPEQRRIAEVINVARAEEARLKAQVQALRLEKAALMSQLLTGKRRVKLPDAEAEAQA